MRKTKTNHRSYDELIRISDFYDRLSYLELKGIVAYPTFDTERALNQRFYRSQEWLRVREAVIVRDYACDLGDPGHPIPGKIIVHHMNPITIVDLYENPFDVLDPRYLISVSNETHQFIHYSNIEYMRDVLKPRRQGDTTLW